ncbi:MAG: ABC transporter permease [Actinobacteria bacterium]|nr:MAG: ABC transporter permease [Actinomycetota bacterium]
MAIRDKGGAAEAKAAAAVGSGALASEATHVGAGATVLQPVARSQWQLFRRRFFKHKVAVAAGVVLLLLYLSAIFAGQVTRYPLNPNIAQTQAQAGPSASHWFGTDELGRDQFTRIIYAGRISLAIGLSVAVVSTAVGSLIGAAAGYFGRWADQLLMRLTDLFLVVPALAILLIAQKKFGGSVPVIIIVLSLLFWQYIARVVRGVFLSLKEKEFVEAARASGASSWRIIFRHMLPNAIGPIAVNATLAVALAILTESTLSFLGFGVRPPTVSWGNMLQQSEGAVGTSNAYLIYFPGLFILVTVMAVNFLGDGLRDAFDPQSKH